MRSIKLSILPRRMIPVACALLLAGCDEGKFAPMSLFPETATQDDKNASAPQTITEEQDVEAPDIFATTEAGLWDGRPSLGGVWVAHPDVSAPERVLIRNQSNGATTIGALFRRERDVPGPRLQVSSDAASALGMLAGAPVELDVVALRKETVAVTPAADPASKPTGDQDEVIVAAASAIDAATIGAEAAQPSYSSGLQRPFLQAGLFSNEENASRAVALLEQSGVAARTRVSQSANGTYWRVLVGPSATLEARDASLAKVRAAGFEDAYPVAE